MASVKIELGGCIHLIRAKLTVMICIYICIWIFYRRHEICVGEVYVIDKQIAVFIDFCV